MVPEGESPSDATADVADGPKDENEEGKEEDDELAEYGLDKYDEEDVGEDVCAQLFGKYLTVYCLLCILKFHWESVQTNLVSIVCLSLI